MLLPDLRCFPTRAAEKWWPFCVLLLGLILALAPISRAAPPASGSVNLLSQNPGFEDAADATDNLWDGVDSDGNLAGFPFSAQVVNEGGSFAGLAMPPAVTFVDVNGDGLPDLVTADPTGYFRFYPNRGTLTAPKFTNAEIIPLFVSVSPRIAPYDEHGFTPRYDTPRTCPRFALADWRHTGLLDLIIGDYFGEVFFIPNTGTAKQPVYRPTGGDDQQGVRRGDDFPSATERPATSVEKARISTNDQGRYWANLLSPVAYDWTGRGKLDLLCGEGSYSANAIHLLANVGPATPKFTSTQHTIVAYGDGREQLIPTIADLNGDGLPDLIVADRTGEVGLYLSTVKPGPGVEVKRASTLTFGGTSKLPGLCSLYAADYNGDGLIDLLIGLPSGHIAVALNTGTKTAPSFGPIKEIKGVDRLGRNLRSPPHWQTENDAYMGNALAYFTVVSAQDDPASQPPEGTHCLKAGYWPAVGTTFPMPASGIPGMYKHFMLSYHDLTLDSNKSYRVSFKAKGQALENLHWEFRTFFFGFPDPVEEKNERGGVRDASRRVIEVVHAGSDFSVGSNWSEVSGEFVPRYKSQLLSDKKKMPGEFIVDFWAQDLTGVMYLDDFRLTAGQ